MLNRKQILYTEIKILQEEKKQYNIKTQEIDKELRAKVKELFYLSEDRNSK